MRNQLHVKVPRTATKAEVVRLMVKLNHPMESGWRQGPDGHPVPQDLASKLVCLFNGREVFRADLDSGTASDPYLSFYVRMDESGLFRFQWAGAESERHEKTAWIEVKG